MRPFFFSITIITTSLLTVFAGAAKAACPLKMQESSVLQNELFQGGLQRVPCRPSAAVDDSCYNMVGVIKSSFSHAAHLRFSKDAKLQEVSSVSLQEAIAVEEHFTASNISPHFFGLARNNQSMDVQQLALQIATEKAKPGQRERTYAQLCKDLVAGHFLTLNSDTKVAIISGEDPRKLFSLAYAKTVDHLDYKAAQEKCSKAAELLNYRLSPGVFTGVSECGTSPSKKSFNWGRSFQASGCLYEFRDFAKSENERLVAFINDPKMQQIENLADISKSFDSAKADAIVKSQVKGKGGLAGTAALVRFAADKARLDMNCSQSPDSAKPVTPEEAAKGRAATDSSIKDGAK